MASHEERRLAHDERQLAFEEAQAKQKAKEDKAANGPLGILGTVLSMGSSVGGMIPNLLKSRQDSELRKYQQGQGAGASLARRTASEAARRVVGASTVNAASGRGGGLREGLRAADSIVQRGAAQAATTGAQEGLAATGALRQSELARRGAGQLLGAGVGQGLAGIAGMLAASKDQGPVQPGDGTGAVSAEQALLEGQGALGGVDQARASNIDPNTGLAIAPADQTQATIEAGQAGLDQFRGNQPQGPPQAGEPAAIQGTGDFAVPGGIGGQMQDARQRGAASFQEPNAEAVKAQQAVNQRAINVQELMQVTADKRDAADAYRRAVVDRDTLVSGTSSTVPAFDPNDPWNSYEWAYNEAANYNPSMQLGLHPEEVARMIIDWGGQPDWERLGLPQQPISNQAWPSGRQQGASK